LQACSFYSQTETWPCVIILWVTLRALWNGNISSDQTDVV